MSEAETSDNVEPGFCSAICTDRESLQREIQKPELKTSDMFATCNLPKRFEHPREFIQKKLYCRTLKNMLNK